MVSFGNTENKMLHIQKFAHGQVKYHNAKFGVHIKNARYPINNLTIDEDGILHGYDVMTQSHQHRKLTYSKELTEFADSMKGVMKVHSALIITMQQPLIYNHN